MELITTRLFSRDLLKQKALKALKMRPWIVISYIRLLFLLAHCWRVHIFGSHEDYISLICITMFSFGVAPESPLKGLIEKTKQRLSNVFGRLEYFRCCHAGLEKEIRLLIQFEKDALFQLFWLAWKAFSPST